MAMKNKTFIFTALAIITFCIATVTVVPPEPLFSIILGIVCNFLTVIFSILAVHWLYYIKESGYNSKSHKFTVYHCRLVALVMVLGGVLS